MQNIEGVGLTKTVYLKVCCESKVGIYLTKGRDASVSSRVRREEVPPETDPSSLSWILVL